MRAAVPSKSFPYIARAVYSLTAELDAPPSYEATYVSRFILDEEVAVTGLVNVFYLPLIADDTYVSSYVLVVDVRTSLSVSNSASYLELIAELTYVSRFILELLVAVTGFVNLV